MPKNTVNVARGPGRKWGNPFFIGAVRLEIMGDIEEHEITPEEAVGDFERLMADRGPSSPDYPSIAEIRAELAGKNLACWCPLDGPCHADTLLRIANGGEI